MCHQFLLFCRQPIFLISGISSVSFYGSGSTTSSSVQVWYSTNAGSSWTQSTNSPFSLTTGASVLKTATIGTSGATIIKFLRTAGTVYLDDIAITCGSPSPTLTATPSTLTAFNYTVGVGPSTSQSFVLDGTNLDGSQTVVTPTSDYEVSTDNTNFFASRTILHTAFPATVYVRLKAGLGINSYAENITCTDNGTASAITVTVSGSVTAVPAPEIDVQGLGLSIVDGDATPDVLDDTDFGSTAVSSTVDKTFTIENAGTANLTITGSVAISGTNAADFSVFAAPSSPITATNTTTFTIRFTPSATGLRTATLTITNNDADEGTYNFDIQGTGTALPDVVLADNGTQTIAANVLQSTTNHILHQSSLAVTTASATLTGMTCTTAGTYLSADITNLKVTYSVDNSFATTGDNTLLSTYTTPGVAGAKTFPSFTSQAISSGSTGYIFITADVAAGAVVGNSINIAALATTDFTFTSANKSGSSTASGAQTFTALVPDVVLADNGTQVATANVSQGTTNHILHQSSLAVTTANSSLTGMTCTTSGSYISADITNLKVWYSADNAFGSDVLLSTYTTPGVAGAKTFPSFTSQAINSGSTGYIFITTDIAAGATVGNTINVDALTTSDFTFASATKSGSSTIGGTQTVILNLAPCMVESFVGFTTAGGTVDVSASLNTYTQTAGWTGSKVYEDAGTVKLGTSSLVGYITSPAFDLTGGGTLTFDIQKYGTDAGLVQVFLDGVQVGANITPPATYATQTLTIPVGTATSVIKIGTTAKRVNLDNFSVSCGGAAVPDISIATPNPSVAIGNVMQGTLKHPIYKFTTAVTTADATLNSVTFNTTNSLSTDITKYQLWYNSADVFGSATQIGSDITATLGTGAHTFSGLTQTVTNGATGYFWITVDISNTATVTNTLSVSSAMLVGDLTFASGNKTIPVGTYTGGIQTITAGTATLSSSISTLSGFNYDFGNGPSANQTFTISGAFLVGTGNITVSGTTNYEVSTDGTTYAASVTYPYTGGVITGQPKTVYVRLKTGKAVGSYNTENVAISGGSATAINVTCNGSVTQATVVLADNGTQVAAANVNQGTTDHVLHKFSLAVSSVNTTLSGVTCTTAGNYASADINNLKVWYSADNAFGSDVLLSTYTTPGTAGSKVFPSFTPQVITAATTGYVFITADVAAGATAGNTISVNAVTTGQLTFSLTPSISGSTSAGGAQTFVVPSGPIDLANWNFPSSPDDNVADGGIAINLTKTLTLVGGPAITNSYNTAGATTNCAKANTWATGSGSKYWQIVFNTVGYQTIKLSSAQNGSSTTGPRDFKVQYSTDGSTWTDVTSGAVPALAANWTTGVLIDLALPSACDNKADVYIRWIMTSNTAVNGTTVATAGTSAIDDIRVTGVVSTLPFITVGTVTTFGNQCITSASVQKSYNVSGSNLTNDITITPPSGYEISTISGSGFATTPIVLTQSGGTVANTTIYVRFVPSTAVAYNGNITHISTGATQQDIPLTGTGINTATTITNTWGITNITSTDASSGYTTASGGCYSIVDRGVCWSTTSPPTIADFISSDGSGNGSSVTSIIDGLIPNTTYYVKSYADNGTTVVYGTSQSFTTLKEQPSNYPTSFACSVTSYKVIDLTWTAVSTGAILPDGYMIAWSDVSYAAITSPSDYSHYTGNYAYVTGVASNAYTVTGLSPNTNYYFKIFPYTNLASGSENYKIGGSEPQSDCLTTDGPCAETDFPTTGTPSGFTATSINYNSTTGRTGLSGDQAAYFNAVADNIYFVNTNSDVLTFWTRASISTSNFTLKVQSSPDNSVWTDCVGGTFSANGANTGTITTTWAQQMINVSLAGTYYIRFYITTSVGAGLYIDDISMTCTVFSPDITITTPIVSAANVAQNTDEHIIYNVNMGIGVTNALLYSASFTTSGNYQVTDLKPTPFKLWYNSTNTFATATQLGSSLASVTGAGETILFDGFSRAIGVGNTGYFWVTADIRCDATIGRTIGITGADNIDFTFQLSNFVTTGTYTASGAQTVIVGTAVSNVTSLVATSLENMQTTISWTNPALCYNDVLIVMSTSSITATPSGNGSLYTANTVYSTGGSNGNLPAGEYCVYKAGSTSPVVVTGLVNGTTYYVKVFTRNGTYWSSGVETTCKPNIFTVLYPADLAIIAVNTNYSGGRDEVCFISFRDINESTTIDFTDNGYEREIAGKWGETEGVIRMERVGGGTIAAGTPICFRGKDDPANFDIFECGTPADANWVFSDIADYSYTPPFNMNIDDQIWIMQNATWMPGDATVDHDATYAGDLLYGWTATPWKTNVGTAGPEYWAADGTHGSVLVPGSECFNTDVSGVPVAHDRVKYIGSLAIGSQSQWITRINDPANWMGYLSTADYNAVVGRDYSNGSGGCINFPVNGTLIDHTGGSSGLWTGEDGTTDWFNCNNWEDKLLPDQATDVRIRAMGTGSPAVSQHVVIDDGTTSGITAAEASCNNIIFEDPSTTLTMDNANSVLNVYGNFINNGDFVATLGSVNFIGALAQDISGAAAITFYDTEVNKSANQVSLSTGFTVNHQLTLTANNFVLGNNNITIAATGSIINGATNSFITTDGSGYLYQNNLGSTGRSTSILYPIGISTSSYTPLQIQNLGTDDNFFINVSQNVLTGGTTGAAVTAGAVDRTWNINEVTSGGSNVSATFQWNAGDELSGFTRTACFVSHYSSSWDSPATASAGGGSPYTLSRTGLNSFSPHAVLSDVILPIELLTFNAVRDGKYVNVNWTTVSERNNDFFTIEHSKDANVFEFVTNYPGAGNSNDDLNYGIIDYRPFSTRSYYRLKQTDYDGKYSYSNIVAVDGVQNGDNFIIDVYQNENVIQVNIDNNPETKYYVEIMDMLGKIIFKEEYHSIADKIIIDIDCRKYPLGIYNISIFNETSVKTQKIIVK
ncbi:MAG: hypothetical protein A2033_18310 [Bacteroidetes bacterium GWA2_31_9]|nr:MAG: hypothetical protein A2033_18310 [Bacteroidetes bacterium GWA2_31_9]